MSNQSSKPILPGIKLGGYKSDKEEFQNDSKWNLRAVTQGPQGGLLSDYAFRRSEKLTQMLVSGQVSAEISRELKDTGSSTCELPISTGNERPNKGKTLYRVPETGELVYECTRGCYQEWRKGVCFHGIPFSGHCFETCVECRKPYRGRRKKNEFVGDFKTGQKYDASKCLPPWQVLRTEHPGLQAVWEYNQKHEPWSEQEARGLDQSVIDPLRVAMAKNVKVPVYQNFDGTLIKDQELANGEAYAKSFEQLKTLGGVDNNDQMFKGWNITRRPTCPRLVPVWITDKSFMKEFIEWIYPNDTQLEKRRFAAKLIWLYWIELQPADLVQTELNLTSKGLESRLARLKEKAAEFNTLKTTLETEIAA
jgi:hypothetical protein